MQKTQSMTLGSFFDGIGGALLAAQHADITPVWASEIESFPKSITEKHFPNVIHLGDITKIDPDTLPPVDIICAGSPCQDLSIAGKREGLNGERSGLFRTAINLVHRLRERTGKPRFFVWENVPGAFSSNKGLDFRAVLEEIGQTEIPMPPNGKWANAGLAELPQCQIAWRVLDAQYWGVPQRRRRIFLVADFAASGRCAGEILFECEGVSGDIAASERAGGGASRGTQDCIRAAGFIGKAASSAGSIGYQAECASTLLAGKEMQVLTYKAISFYNFLPSDIGATLLTGGVVSGGGSENLVLYKGIVRKLTPTECERLQGLPDGYTEGGSDTARYKALGNGMAQPCIDYVIRRIAECA